MSDDPAERPAQEVPSEKGADSTAAARKPDPPLEPAPTASSFAWIRDLSKAGFIVGVISLALTTAGTVIAVTQLGGGSSATDSGRSSKRISTAETAQSPAARAPSPLLSSNASCKEFRDAAAHGSGTRLPIDSPGQIGGGPAVRVRVLPHGRFVEVARVSPGDELEVSAQLSNGDYTSADGVSVSASISSERGECWRIIESAKAESFPEAHPRLGPVLILLEGGGSARLGYVSGSTKLVDERGHTLDAELPDGLIHGWLRLPYAVPGGTSYFLSFRVRVRSRAEHVSSSS